MVVKDGPLFFWGGGGGDKKSLSLSANFFLSMHLCKQFFSNNTFLQTIFFRSFLTTIPREFQYKVLNCIVYTNEKLFRLGIVDSSKCIFCQKEAESIEHLLFSCAKSSEFWKSVLSWLRDNGIRIDTLKETDLIFGKFDSVYDFIIINHMLLLGKYYIHSMRCQKNLPNLSGFIARTRRIF